MLVVINDILGLSFIKLLLWTTVIPVHPNKSLFRRGHACPQAPLLLISLDHYHLKHHCLRYSVWEMYTNNNDAMHFYTSFPSYKHFMICFSFLGDAVNHLIYSGSKTDSSRVARCKPQRSITPINEFFMTLCHRIRSGISI